MSNFKPVRLFASSEDLAAEVDRIQNNIQDITSPIEIQLSLSYAPPNLFWVYFTRSWNVWYPNTPQPRRYGNKLTVSCTPELLPSRVAQIKLIIESANMYVGPAIAAEVAQAAAAKLRLDALNKFESERHQFNSIIPKLVGEHPSNSEFRQFNEAIEIRDQTIAAKLREIERDCARRVLKDAVYQIIDNDLNEVLTRTAEGNPQ